MSELAEDEVKEEATMKVVKNKGTVKKSILATISLVLVAVIGFGGYFLVENEKKYIEHKEEIKLYVEKIEKASEKMNTLAKAMSIQDVVQGGRLWRINSMERGLKEVGEEKDFEELKRLGNEIIMLSSKINMDEEVLFHKELEEINKELKTLKSDYGKCYKWLMAPAQIFQEKGSGFFLTSNYNDYAGELKNSIRKVKKLIE